MNTKLIFGVIIPVVIILLLVGLYHANIGFSIEEETVPELKLNDLFVKKYQDARYISIDTIIIHNDFFLSKRYELPRYLACLIKNGDTPGASLSLQYDHSDTARGRPYEFFDQLLIPYQDNPYQESVEVSAYGKKQVNVLIQQRVSREEYDSLLLVPLSDQDGYGSCYNLDPDKYKNVKTIALV